MLKSGPKLVTCQEDDEFQAQLDRIMNEVPSYCVVNGCVCVSEAGCLFHYCAQQLSNVSVDGRVILAQSLKLMIRKSM